MQLIGYLLSNLYLNMFRASLCPSSGEQDHLLLHMVFCTGCAGCGCVELGRKLCAKPSINTSKYAIFYPHITSLFSEHHVDGLRLHQCIVASVSGSCRTRASVGPHQ